MENCVPPFDWEITLRRFGLGETERDEAEMTIPSREEFGVLGEKFLSPLGQGSEQADVDFLVDVRCSSGRGEHRMISEREMKAAQATRPVAGYA